MVVSAPFQTKRIRDDKLNSGADIKTERMGADLGKIIPETALQIVSLPADRNRKGFDIGRYVEPSEMPIGGVVLGGKLIETSHYHEMQTPVYEISAVGMDMDTRIIIWINAAHWISGADMKTVVQAAKMSRFFC